MHNAIGRQWGRPLVRAFPLLFFLLSAACEGDTCGPAAMAAPPRVVLAPSTATLKPGQILHVRAIAYQSTCGTPPNVARVPLTWSVLDTTIVALTATTDTSATALGKNAGKTTVLARETDAPDAEIGSAELSVEGVMAPGAAHADFPPGVPGAHVRRSAQSASPTGKK